MLRIIAGLFIFMFPMYLHGQLFMLSDNYVHNSLAINPAFSGSEDALDISVFYRSSLTGFEGSPKTMSLAAHAPVYHEKIGIGFLILNDKIGVSKETNLIANYAYRIPMAQGRLALGLGFGTSIVNIDWDKLAPQDPGDEMLMDNITKGVLVNFSTGVYYYTKKLFLGLSLPLFLSHKYDFKKDKYVVLNNFKEYNYFANAGYSFNVDENIKFTPSVLIKYHEGKNSQIDLGSMASFKNRFSLGATYRSKNVFISMFQLKINNQLKIGYSYDFNTGVKTQYRTNSNEFMLNYKFEYSVSVPRPRQF